MYELMSGTLICTAEAVTLYLICLITAVQGDTFPSHRCWEHFLPLIDYLFGTI